MKNGADGEKGFFKNLFLITSYTQIVTILAFLIGLIGPLQKDSSAGGVLFKQERIRMENGVCNTCLLDKQSSTGIVTLYSTICMPIIVLCELPLQYMQGIKDTHFWDCYHRGLHCPSFCYTQVSAPK